jgi:hypothetical protein
MIRNRFLMMGFKGLLLLPAGLLAGCAAFQSSKRMDMSPFSENTSTMFVEVARISRPFPWENAKPYVISSDFDDFRQRAGKVLGAFRGIVFYSNQVVALNNAKMDDKKKNDQLAKYIEEATRKVSEQGMLDSIGIDAAELKAILADVRNAEVFLEGIAAASPLINAIVVSMGNQLESIQSSIPKVFASVDSRIEADYADRKSNYANLVRLQVATMRGMTQIYKARRGDQASLDTLLREDPSVRELIPSPEKATGKSLAAAEAVLTDRAMKLDTFIHQMDSEAATYRAKRRELSDWQMSVEEKIKIARDAIAVWAQSHRNLGAGIPVPPLIDVGGIAKGLAKTVVPLP